MPATTSRWASRPTSAPPSMRSPPPPPGGGAPGRAARRTAPCWPANSPLGPPPEGSPPKLGRDVASSYGMPDFVADAESFGARGSQVSSAADLLPMLADALASGTVSVIACPVDYSENLQLTDALGELTGPF